MVIHHLDWLLSATVPAVGLALGLMLAYSIVLVCVDLNLYATINNYVMSIVVGTYFANLFIAKRLMHGSKVVFFSVQI